jgi:hypothetical protein
MIVEAEVVAVDKAGRRRLDRPGVDHDGRVVGPVHARKNRIELVIAVDED